MSPHQIESTLEAMKGHHYSYNGNTLCIEMVFMRPVSKEFKIVTDHGEFERDFSVAESFLTTFKPVNGLPRTNELITRFKSIQEPVMNSTQHHTPSSVIVYSTNDYSRFKMLNGNRTINMRKVNKIIKEIEHGNDMLRYYPIQVKENEEQLDILDGQHRFVVDQKLKRPVYYFLVEEEKTMPDIAKVNSNVEKWKTDDYINCYIQQNNQHYKELKQFMDTYHFSTSMAVSHLGR